MKIEKLKNSYSCRIYDKNLKKQVRVSASTRRELIKKVAVMQDTFEHASNISLMQAIDDYIDVKKPVLSPTTINGYNTIKKRLFEYDMPLNKLTETKIQEIVSALSEELTPKSVRNHYALLKSALRMQGIEINATLPKPIKPKLCIPSDNDIKVLLDYFRDTEMELIILFAVYIPMRRGEICALNYEDIKDGYVNITKTMVYNGDDYIIKDSPKTYAGYRTVKLPQIIADKISIGTGKIFTLNVTTVTHRFKRAVEKLKLNHIRFHDLRHYSASKFHAMGIPDKYIIKRGGWETENIMKRIYQDTITEKEKEVNDLIDKSLDF